MFHDSQSTRTTEPTLGNSALQDLDLTGQLTLDRPMLVARIDRPGAQLVLENAPSPRKSIRRPCCESSCPSTKTVQTPGVRPRKPAQGARKASGLAARQ